TTAGNGFFLDLAHVGGDATDLSTEQFVAAVFQIDVVVDRRSDFLARGAVRGKPLVIRNPEFLIALYSAIPVFIGPFSLMSKSIHHEVIDTQDSGNCGHNVFVEATDGRPDNHDGRYPDNDADQG